MIRLTITRIYMISAILSFPSKWTLAFIATCWWDAGTVILTWFELMAKIIRWARFSMIQFSLKCRVIARLNPRMFWIFLIFYMLGNLPLCKCIEALLWSWCTSQHLSGTDFPCNDLFVFHIDRLQIQQHNHTNIWTFHCLRFVDWLDDAGDIFHWHMEKKDMDQKQHWFHIDHLWILSDKGIWNFLVFV